MASPAPVTLCVDAGTTAVKAVVFDDAGGELAAASQPTTVLTPGERCMEQDMEEAWTAVAGAARSALAGVESPVRAIAVTAQGDGCWLVDGDRRPVRPAVLWNDGRADEVVARWQADGVLAEAFGYNGALTFAGLPNAILAALHATEPTTVERARAALTCGGWLFAQLTDVVAIDRSDAAAPWLDVTAGVYADEVLELFDLRWAAQLRPRLLGDGERVAELSTGAAETLGVGAGIPVVYAPYDVAAGAWGVGSVEPGQACCVLGTTLSSGTVIGHPVNDGEPSGLTVATGHDDRWLRIFPTLSGCGVVDWAADLLGLQNAADLSELAALAPPGSDGVRLAPYLSPAGERAPFLDADAAASLTGFDFRTGRAHVARAVLEGLAHTIRESVQAAPVAPTEIRLSGGGAASDLWCQIIADVTGVAALRSDSTHASAKGALLASQVALGLQPDAATAAAHVVYGAQRWEPDPANAALFTAAHEEFLATRAQLRPRWPAWRALARQGAT